MTELNEQIFAPLKIINFSKTNEKFKQVFAILKQEQKRVEVDRRGREKDVFKDKFIYSIMYKGFAKLFQSG